MCTTTSSNRDCPAGLGNIQTLYGQVPSMGGVTQGNTGHILEVLYNKLFTLVIYIGQDSKQWISKCFYDLNDILLYC